MIAFQAMSKAEWVALKDCANSAHTQYVWKPKTMAKLEAKGFVESTGLWRGMPSWGLTAKGRSALEDDRP